MKLRLFLLAALCAAVVLAQIGTSTITGRVTDSTGAVIPAVQVTIVHPATNFTYNAVTNVEGIYRVPSLQPGLYRVTFEAEGFKKSIREQVELRTGDTLAVDMNLEVGSLTESIEVTGETPLLETETSATGTVVSGTVLYDMPLYQRYINSTLNLVPGMTSGGYAYGGSLGSYHVAGQRSGAIGIFEDGVNGNDQQGGSETIKPLQNSVAEVKVLTTVPPAEYGHSAGGVIAMQFALRYPERTAGLVLVGTASECNERAHQFYEDLAAVAEQRGMASVHKRLGLGADYQGPAADPAAFAKVARCMGNLLHAPLTARLDEIQCPTLIIVGEKDFLGAGGSVILSRRIAGSELHIVPERGHGIFLEDPDGFVALLTSFLDELDPRRG